MIPLIDKPNVTSPTLINPFGQLQDDDGSGIGTPVTKDVYQDHHIFFAKIMDESSITPNGLLDNAYDFQLWKALLKCVVSDDARAGRKIKEIPITNWNMDTTVVKTVAHGLSVTKIRSVRALIISDLGIRHMLDTISTSGVAEGGYGSIGLVDVSLICVAGGMFDTANYSGTGDRGFLEIEYVD